LAIRSDICPPAAVRLVVGDGTQHYL